MVNLLSGSSGVVLRVKEKMVSPPSCEASVEVRSLVPASVIDAIAYIKKIHRRQGVGEQGGARGGAGVEQTDALGFARWLLCVDQGGC